MHREACGDLARSAEARRDRARVLELKAAETAGLPAWGGAAVPTWATVAVDRDCRAARPAKSLRQRTIERARSGETHIGQTRERFDELQVHCATLGRAVSPILVEDGCEGP